MDYKMGILQRYECQQFALDQKKTLFGMTIDGISAFDVVPRPLLLWELFNKGEEGKIWQFTNYNYQNTTCRVKMNGKLSRTFEETLGVGQGKSRASDHYKVFNQPLLDNLEDAQLGIWCGDICVSVDGIADDVYLLCDDPVKLQAAIHLVEDYGRKYGRFWQGENQDSDHWFRGGRQSLQKSQAISPYQLP